MLERKQSRTYIERIRNDPRTRSMMQGWIAQATHEADQRFPYPYDDRERTHYAAERAIQLAMSFVIDNDGELSAVRDQLDKVLQHSIDLANLTPRPLVLKVERPPE